MVKGFVFFIYLFIFICKLKKTRYPKLRKVKVSVMSDSLRLMDYTVHPGQHTGIGILSLLHGIFPTHGLNPGLPHCRQILYQLNHKGSPRILEWIAYPFSSSSSWPRNWTRVSRIAGRFFTNWAMREATYLKVQP